MTLHFILVQNRQGKTRLSKWYDPYSDDEKNKTKGDIHRLIAPRDQKHQSNFAEYLNYKVIYRRYAGLFFCACIDLTDNELGYLEAIHLFVEILDAYFGNVCELDLVFNFWKMKYSWLEKYKKPTRKSSLHGLSMCLVWTEAHYYYRGRRIAK